MKRIRLLSLPDPRFPHPGDPNYENARVDYRRLVEDAIRVPLDREKGANIDEMRKGIRVLDALDASQHEVLELEDADWEFLKQKVEKMPWAMVDRRFVQFHDDITGASDAVRDPTHANGAA
jgi:hypothetical protein